MILKKMKTSEKKGMTNPFKRCFFIRAAFLAFFLRAIFTPLFAEIPMGNDKYKTIQIYFSIEGKYQKGYEVFVQKANKTYRKTSIETKILTKTYWEKTLEIDDGLNFYRINLINKTGIKLPSLNKLKKEMVQKNPHLFQNGRFNPLRVVPHSGLLDYKDTVLGRECEIYLSHNRFIYIWDHIILQEIYDFLGKTVKKAEKLKVDDTVNDSYFKVPDEISFQTKDISEINISDLSLPADF